MTSLDGTPRQDDQAAPSSASGAAPSSASGAAPTIVLRTGGRKRPGPPGAGSKKAAKKPKLATVLSCLGGDDSDQQSVRREPSKSANSDSQRELEEEERRIWQTEEEIAKSIEGAKLRTPQSRCAGDQDVLFDEDSSRQGQRDCAASSTTAPPPSLDQPISKDGNESEDAAGAADGGEKKLVSVIHPDQIDIETRLGPRSPDDDWCYLCDLVFQMNPDARPKEATDLMLQMTEQNASMRDKVDVAIYTQALYERTILGPVSRKASATGQTVLKKWTRRSIHNHLTKKASRASYRIDQGLDLVSRILESLDMGLWRAPKSKVNSKTKTADVKYLHLKKKNLIYIDKYLAKSIQLMAAREKLQGESDGSYGTGGRAGATSSKRGGAASGRRAGTESVSHLGSVASSRRSGNQALSDRALQSKADRSGFS
jgi:hypothetical protein